MLSITLPNPDVPTWSQQEFFRGQGKTQLALGGCNQSQSLLSVALAGAQKNSMKLQIHSGLTDT